MLNITCVMLTPQSRNLLINHILRPQRHQEIRWHFLGQLPLLRPLPHGVIISTLMLGIEINKRTRILAKCPYLSQHAHINRTHELLAQDVEAVRNVKADDVVSIREGTLPKGVVVVVIVVESLA